MARIGDDPTQTQPPRVWLELEAQAYGDRQSEAHALLDLLAPHAGRGPLRTTRHRLAELLQPPAYRFAVPSIEEAAATAVAALDNLWDHPHTFRAAQDELHRLHAALRKHGVSIPRDSDSTNWRGPMISMLWRAGFRLTRDHAEWRLLLGTDKDEWTPTGPTLTDLVAFWKAHSREYAELRDATIPCPDCSTTLNVQDRACDVCQWRAPPAPATLLVTPSVRRRDEIVAAIVALSRRFDACSFESQTLDLILHGRGEHHRLAERAACTTCTPGGAP